MRVFRSCCYCFSCINLTIAYRHYCCAYQRFVLAVFMSFFHSKFSSRLVNQFFVTAPHSDCAIKSKSTKPAEQALESTLTFTFNSRSASCPCHTAHLCTTAHRRVNVHAYYLCACNFVVLFFL